MSISRVGQVIKRRVEPGTANVRTSDRERVAEWCMSISRLAFFLTILTLPSPVFWEIVPRHVGSLEPQYRSVLLYLSDVPLLATVAAWTLAHIISPSRPVRLGPWYVAWPGLIILVLTVLSVSWARAVPVAAETAVRTIVLYALYLMVVNEQRTQRLLAWGLIAAVIANAPLALVQLHLQAPIGLKVLGEIGWPKPVTGAWIRGYGLSPHPNILGGYLALGLLVLVGLRLERTREEGGACATRQGQRIGSIVTGFLIGVGVGGLLSTFSRSAWLGFSAGLLYLGVIVLWRPIGRQSRARLAQCILIVLVSTAAFGIAYHSLVATRLVLPVLSILRGEPVPGSELEMGVIDERNLLHQAAMQVISSAPVLGVGAGNFTVAYYEESGPEYPFRFYQPEHNVPLLLSAELGPLAGMSWLLLAGAPIVSMISRRKFCGSYRPYLWAAALLTVFLISGFDFYFWSRQQGRPLFWALVAAWVASYGPGRLAPASTIIAETTSPTPCDPSHCLSNPN